MFLWMEKESTEKMKRFGNKAAHGLGLFSCLPEDILMSILNRIHDLKCLFQFTLVSKDFALKTHRIKSISLKLRAFDIDSIETPIDMFHLSPEMLGSELQKFSRLRPPPSPRQELKCTKFLQKFTELECASFEAPCPQTPCSSPSLKWQVKLRNCTPAVQMLVSVLPKTFNEATESEPVEEGNEEENDNEEVSGTLDEFSKYLAKGCLSFSLMNFAEWFDLMFSLIKQHDTLKSVICTDTGKHGKIVLNEEQIVEWRKMLLCGELSHKAFPENIFYGWVPSSVPGYQKDWFVIMNFMHSEEIADAAIEILKKAHTFRGGSYGWYANLPLPGI